MASSTSAAAHRLGELHDHGAVERRGRRVEVAGGVTIGHVLREVAPPALHPQLIDRHAEGDEHVGDLLARSSLSARRASGSPTSAYLPKTSPMTAPLVSCWAYGRRT